MVLQSVYSVQRMRTMARQPEVKRMQSRDWPLPWLLQQGSSGSEIPRTGRTSDRKTQVDKETGWTGMMDRTRTKARKSLVCGE